MLLSTRRVSLPTTDPVLSMRREMDHLFNRFFNEPENGTTRGWYAPVAMWDDADKVYLEVELPGVSKDDVDLTVHNGVLRISGERKIPEGDRNYWVNDRAYGTFDRTISLPDDVDANSIDAQLADGVLRIELSKRPESQPKKIVVKGGSQPGPR
jgi:HSP20 family protein